MRSDLLDLSFIVPGSNENRWSDLLATLVATDPLPMQDLLGVNFDGVRREVVVSGSHKTSDRLDLLLTRDGHRVVAIEVKLLSDLGPRQLMRYSEAFSDVETFKVLHLKRLPVNLRRAEHWQSLTWECVLSAYSRSANEWVATTARSWIQQLDDLIPRIGPDTIWNDVPDDPAGFELALRARIAWLDAQMEAWCELEHGIEPSSGGGNWAVQMSAPSTSPGHTVTAELQEGLTAFAWKPDPQNPYKERLPGPVVLLGLRQTEVSSSAQFDWQTLRRIFDRHVLDESGRPSEEWAWLTRPAQPRDPIDKRNWQAIVAAGAPRWLGKGWGMSVAKSVNICHFGARLSLAPDSRLGDVEVALKRLQPLVLQMASG